jgi:hypothetical protein
MEKGLKTSDTLKKGNWGFYRSINLPITNIYEEGMGNYNPNYHPTKPPKPTPQNIRKPHATTAKPHATTKPPATTAKPHATTTKPPTTKPPTTTANTNTKEIPVTTETPATTDPPKPTVEATTSSFKKNLSEIIAGWRLFQAKLNYFYDYISKSQISLYKTISETKDNTTSKDVFILFIFTFCNAFLTYWFTENWFYYLFYDYRSDFFSLYDNYQKLRNNEDLYWVFTAICIFTFPVVALEYILKQTAKIIKSKVPVFVILMVMFISIYYLLYYSEYFVATILESFIVFAVIFAVFMWLSSEWKAWKLGFNIFKFIFFLFWCSFVITFGISCMTFSRFLIIIYFFIVSFGVLIYANYVEEYDGIFTALFVMYHYYDSKNYDKYLKENTFFSKMNYFCYKKWAILAFLLIICHFIGIFSTQGIQAYYLLYIFILLFILMPCLFLFWKKSIYDYSETSLPKKPPTEPTDLQTEPTALHTEPANLVPIKRGTVIPYKIPEQSTTEQPVPKGRVISYKNQEQTQEPTQEQTQ